MPAAGPESSPGAPNRPRRAVLPCGTSTPEVSDWRGYGGGQGGGHRDDLATVCNATHAGLTGTARRPTYRRNKHPGLFRTLCWGGAPASGYVSVDLEGADDCLWVDEVAGDAGTCLAVLRSMAEAAECNELFFDRLHYKSAVGLRLRQLPSCRMATGTRLGKARWYVVRIVSLESMMTKLAPVLRERLLASWKPDYALRSPAGRVDRARGFRDQAPTSRSGPTCARMSSRPSRRYTANASRNSTVP